MSSFASSFVGVLRVVNKQLVAVVTHTVNAEKWKYFPDY